MAPDSHDIAASAAPALGKMIEQAVLDTNIDLAASGLKLRITASDQRRFTLCYERSFDENSRRHAHLEIRGDRAIAYIVDTGETVLSSTTSGISQEELYDDVAFIAEALSPTPP